MAKPRGVQSFCFASTLVRHEKKEEVIGGEE
uniref:Uncharacterized protein n=1 Tax=Siphoviridae sp. ctdjo3 TaxID=2825583 RepID=A0A8S5PRQ5_9CAUD|nr:MAG TPA: hypothetical protein [Siphoviridae sp. ctdjo3]